MLSGPARKALGWEGFKVTYLLLVTLKPSHPQAITNPSNSRLPRIHSADVQLLAPPEPPADAEPFAPRGQHLVHASRRQKANQPAPDRLDINRPIISLV